MNFCKQVLLLFAMCYVCDTWQVRIAGSEIEIDAIRCEYLKLEENSWDIVKNDINITRSLQQLFENYNSFFTNRFDTVRVQSTEYFIEKMNEWKLLKLAWNPSRQYSPSLFSDFRYMLYSYATGHINYLNMKEFAENQIFSKLLTKPRWTNLILHEITEQLYNKTSDYLHRSKQMCEVETSEQQVLYNMYTFQSAIEIKGVAVMQFSQMLKYIFGEKEPEDLSQLEVLSIFDKFVEEIVFSQQIIKNQMKLAKRDVWRCGPDQHILHTTYEAVTRLLQGHVENLEDIDTDRQCRGSCSDYQSVRNMTCYGDNICEYQPKCQGRLLNCQFVDSHMSMCLSEMSSMRRYDYIQYENEILLGETLAKSENCSNENAFKVKSWRYWLFWECSFCFCICDDERSPKSDRFFNLQESVSNVTANRVITGLRFRKFNRIIHLQIQEGQLEPRGYINPSTLQWKPMSDYDLNDCEIKSGVDYHKLNYDQRAIDLGDLVAPDHHIVTGVRFHIVEKHLNFQIRITKIDFKSGLLLNTLTSIWISTDNTVQRSERTQVNLTDPDVSTNAKSGSLPDSTTNQYIEFTHTDMYVDAAQTTVPYIDVQDAISNPPCALSGAGIYHKGQNKYGGFIAPKLFTYNFEPHVGILPIYTICVRGK